jgi:hypothetical protein
MKLTRLPLLALAAALPVAALASDHLAAARKVFAEKQDSVIWVSGIANLSFTAADSKDAAATPPDEEIKVESLATLVDPSGVAVAVLSQLDPARNVNGRSVRSPRGPVKVEASATLKDLKLILADGTEVPAEIVLKDADHDLAFIRARAGSKEARGASFSSVNLRDSATPAILDEVVCISRMDEIFNRAPNVFSSNINMATRQPRVYYRALGATGGCPTFNTDGKLIGITATRFLKGKQPAAAIIPASDILPGLEQINHAKPAPEGNAAANTPR